MLDFLLYYLILNVYSSLITWKFFVANGRPAWSAWVPVYRTYGLMQISDRPRWWMILCYIPVVDNVMSIILTYELLHMHGFRENKHILLSILTLGGYVGYLNYTAALERGDRDNAEIRSRMPAPGTLVWKWSWMPSAGWIWITRRLPSPWTGMPPLKSCSGGCRKPITICVVRQLICLPLQR